MIFSRIRQYRVYRRLVLSYFLIIAITITLLCTILYSLFSSKAVKEIDLSSQEMLTQVSYTANVVFEQVGNITNQLLNDNQIITFMYIGEDNKQVTYNANLLLTKVQNIYPFISNIGIYNFTNGVYTDVVGMTPDSNMVTHQQSQYIEMFPRKVNNYQGGELKLLTFRIVPEQAFVGSSKSAIVLDIRESYIQNTMRSISATTREASNFVIDAQGTVLSHSNPEFFMDNFSQQEYIRKLLTSISDQGSFVTKLDNKKQLVTYVKSSTLDWYFVSVRPYDQLLSNIYSLRNWTLLIALLLLAVGATTSLLLTGNLYNPIKALMDKVNERDQLTQSPLLRIDEYKLLSDAFTNTIESAKSLESSLQQSAQLLKNNYMFDLLKGNELHTPYTPDIQQSWKQHLKGPYFRVLLFKIDGLAEMKNKFNPVDRGLIRFAVSNIAQELIGQSFAIDIAIMEEEETAFILQTEDKEQVDLLYLILAEIQDTIRNYYNISISVSIGDTCQTAVDIRHSYQSALRYMDQRLFSGYASILDAKRDLRMQDQTARYSTANERKLIDAIKLCNQKAIHKEVVDWIDAITHTSHAQAMQYTNFLMWVIIREFESITESWDIDPNEFYRSMNHMHQAETLEDVQKSVTELCFKIVTIIEENKNSVAALKSAKLIEEVKKFLQEHFTDSNLSLELASEHVGLSAGYIGKLFKSVTGTSFNDYLAHIRLERAKQLLVETTDSIATIGEMVGILNVSYFSTLFKKKYGMTPSQFREQPSA